MVLLRQQRKSLSGATLLELLVVSGLMLVVMTLMAMSMDTSRRAQSKGEQASDSELALRFCRNKMVERIERGRLVSPALGASGSSVQFAPYAFSPGGQILLDAGGSPQLLAAATIKLEGSKVVLDSPDEDAMVLGNLGASAELRVQRPAQRLLSISLRAGEANAPPRELTFRLFLD